MNVITGDNRVRNIVIVSLAGTLVFCALLGGFLWWFLGNEKDAVRKSADQFAAALQDNDPGAAPGEAEEYVDGIRGYFGPVKDARVVDARKVDNYSETSNSANDRSWWVATIFLHSERGAALLLLTYDDGGIDPNTATISQVRELSPKKVAKGALNAEEMADARAGFKARGSKAADVLTLNGSRAEIERVRRGLGQPAKPPKRVKRPKASRQLRCVQEAAGDIEKLKRCAKL